MMKLQIKTLTDFANPEVTVAIWSRQITEYRSLLVMTEIGKIHKKPLLKIPINPLREIVKLRCGHSVFKQSYESKKICYMCKMKKEGKIVEETKENE